MNIGIISGSGSGSAGGSGSGYGIYNTAEMGNIINTGIISGSGSVNNFRIDGVGYGIYNTAEMGNIINAGIISASVSGRNFDYGSGIYNTGTIGAITNTGVISASVSSSYLCRSCGIYNTAEMGNIINTGVISVSGVGGSSFGYGIYNTGTIGDITNTGIISVSVSGSNGYGHGSGIYIESTMRNIINTGIVSSSGSADPDGVGFGMRIESTMRNIINTGIISGYGSGKGDHSHRGAGQGIYNTGTIGAITNTGIISVSGDDEGYGIYNTGTIGAITNTGIISVSSDDEGYGIYNKSKYNPDTDEYEPAKMGNIENTGIIYGKTNAISNNDQDGTITTANNYGILVNGSDNDVIGGLDIDTSAGENKLVNYGLIIKNNGDGGITAGVEGEQTVKFGTSERNMTIKNADIEGGSGIGTSTESIELGNNNYDNFILNGKDKTLKVTGSNDKITGSIINAYGTAVVFGEANKQLTLSGTIVNGGIDENDSNPATKGVAILGSTEGDTLILQSGKIKYKDGSEVTQNTVVNGNINMEAGNDNLTIGAGTIINGTLDGGEGDDILNFGVSGAKSNSPENEEVRILHNISNFEKMNINTNVTLFEKTTEDSKEKELEVTGAENITIGANGTLTLRINSSKRGSGVRTE